MKQEEWPMTKLPEYYSVPIQCVNCGSKFIDDDPGYYSDPGVIGEAINIKKGMKICEVECPVCGCLTLARWRVR